MVEVFKTNVQKINESKKIIWILLEHFPESKINFDLSDCDRILRVESEVTFSEKVIEILTSNGYFAEILTY
ncbi:MAG: hypothetical protein V4585_00880 [Bacteroidota bacterium]